MPYSLQSRQTLSVLVMPCLPILKEISIILYTQSCAVGQNVSICSARESLKRDMQRTRQCERWTEDNVHRRLCGGTEGIPPAMALVTGDWAPTQSGDLSQPLPSWCLHVTAAGPHSLCLFS